MTQLIGSPKQIVWAEDIKANIICKINNMLKEQVRKHQLMVSQGKDRIQADAADRSLKEQVDKLISAAEAQTSASWWIDFADQRIDLPGHPWIINEMACIRSLMSLADVK